MSYRRSHLEAHLASFNRTLTRIGNPVSLAAEGRNGYTAVDVWKPSPKAQIRSIGARAIGWEPSYTLVAGTPKQCYEEVKDYYIGRLEAHIQFLEEK